MLEHGIMTMYLSDIVRIHSWNAGAFAMVVPLRACSIRTVLIVMRTTAAGFVQSLSCRTIYAVNGSMECVNFLCRVLGKYVGKTTFFYMKLYQLYSLYEFLKMRLKEKGYQYQSDILFFYTLIILSIIIFIIFNIFLLFSIFYFFIIFRLNLFSIFSKNFRKILIFIKYKISN